jgi:hypothetical protein
MAQSTPMPFWWNEQLGIETITYSLLLVALAALLIGGAPALKATGAQVQTRLKEAGAGGATMRFGKLWTGVIVTQVAVTVVFLMAVVSLGWYTYDLNKQFMEVAFPRNEYLTGVVRLEQGAPPEREKTVLGELQRRLMEDPAVVNATYAVHLPGGGNPFWLEFPPTGSGQALRAAADAAKRGDSLGVKSARIGMNYFETFRQPLVAGRLFTESDIEAGHNVAIVDESFVRLVLGGRSAVGQLVRQPPQRGGTVYEQTDKPGPWLEIVGVVKDMSLAPDKTTENAMLYRPSAPGDGSSLRVVVHTQSNEGAARLRAAAAATDPELRVSEVMTMDRLAETEAQTMGFFTSALGIVAAVALMLSTAGIYSLISFTLSRRTREIGIRTALGAAPLRIITGILSRAFVQVGIGVILGAIPGVMLLVLGPEVSSGRGWSTAVAAAVFVSLFIIGVAMISCISPVRRALKIQPTEALRTT